MAIKQISVFVENRKGALSHITALFAKEEIDLRAMSIADTSDFGILRIIATETDRALEVLKNDGVIATVTDVVAFAVPDVAGGLAKVLHYLTEGDVNMEYLYALITSSTEKAYIVMRVEDNDAAEAILKENGIEILAEGQMA